MDHDDFHVEPVRGLPERLPDGECILWQGAPNPWALARDALLLRWIIGYFVLLALWRIVARSPVEGLQQAIIGTGPLLILGTLACSLIYGFAYVQARASVYTITNARVVMRIGVALTLTLNLPFSRIASADLALRRDGTGTIAFEPEGERRLGYLVCWPHVRPWHMSMTQPALRAIPDAEAVAGLLSQHAAQVSEQTAHAAVQVAAE